MDTDDPDELAALLDNTLRSLLDRHASVKAAFIMYPTGGAEDFRGGVLKFLEQKKGGYENCLNISRGDAYFL